MLFYITQLDMKYLQVFHICRKFILQFFYNPSSPPAALKKIETVNVYFTPNAIKVAVFKQLKLKQRTTMVS